MIRPDNKQTVPVGDKLPCQVGLLVELVELVRHGGSSLRFD